MQQTNKQTVCFLTSRSVHRFTLLTSGVD